LQKKLSIAIIVLIFILKSNIIEFDKIQNN